MNETFEKFETMHEIQRAAIVVGTVADAASSRQR